MYVHAWAGFEPTITVLEQYKTIRASDDAATGVSTQMIFHTKFMNVYKTCHHINC